MGTGVGMAPLMREYLDRIVMLCRENGISLILTKMPDTDCNVSKYNTMSDYAQEQGIPYWDFNEESLYRASGFVHMEDMNDDWHVNLWGQRKFRAVSLKNCMMRMASQGYRTASGRIRKYIMTWSAGTAN